MQCILLRIVSERISLVLSNLLTGMFIENIEGAPLVPKTQVCSAAFFQPLKYVLINGLKSSNSSMILKLASLTLISTLHPAWHHVIVFVKEQLKMLQSLSRFK